jgi:SAM-dependent methyltransferase
LYFARDRIDCDLAFVDPLLTQVVRAKREIRFSDPPFLPQSFGQHREGVVSEMNQSFSGSMPEFYDHYLVPLRFQPFALDIAERIRGLKSDRVLELAAGTGIVTRALVRSLPASVAITATDLNPAMLERAKTHPGLERVSWKEADALALPFEDEAFDCVVCQFGVMFFSDKRAGFREAQRVIKPGGRFLFNVWDDFEGTVPDEVTWAVGRCLGHDPATFTAPMYNDAGLVRADLTAAGFGSVSVEKLSKPSHSSSARDAAIAYCHGGLTRAHIEKHAPDRLDEITDKAAAAIAARFGNGPIDEPLKAMLFTAVRPNPVCEAGAS